MSNSLKLISAREAVDSLTDGASIAVAGFRWAGAPEALLAALGQRFRETSLPRALSLLFSSAQGDNAANGLEHLAQEGLLNRVVGGFWGVTPKLAALANAEKLAAYNLPQGQIARLYGAIASGQPGLLSRIGIGTYMDPRHGGGKFNRSATESLVNLVSINGEEWLLYRSIHLDFGFIRGTTADVDGNISFEREAMSTEALSLAFAVKNCGGTVIAQVSRIVPRGTIRPRDVSIPSYAVDKIVLASDIATEHRQCVASVFDPALVGEGPVPEVRQAPGLPLVRAIVAGRALQELRPGDIVNLGQGIPSEISSLIRGGPLDGRVTFTVESGVSGGVPRAVPDFGIAEFPRSIIRHDDIFMFYNGGGLTAAFLGFAQVGPDGSVNASRFGGRTMGSGGFMDIAQTAKRLIFCGAFTAGDIQVSISDGRLAIQREGTMKKFVSELDQVTLNSRSGRPRNQQILYVTERCVFSLSENGLVLKEVAPGIDIQKDLLDQMGFRPILPDSIPPMDLRAILAGHPIQEPIK